ncbi:MAG: hypothetical protein ABIG37_03370 [Nanoarchaeota archaeon]|nr:hypothetical protein [Nanoarchaeota archaeon]
MRIFLSFDIPDEIKENIKGIQKKFEGCFIGKFTELENLHLTLKFLVNKLILKESSLTEKGPIYRDILKISAG